MQETVSLFIVVTMYFSKLFLFIYTIWDMKLLIFRVTKIFISQKPRIHIQNQKHENAFIVNILLLIITYDVNNSFTALGSSDPREVRLEL